MAAIPSYTIGLGRAQPVRAKAKTRFSVSSNELGAHSFFPSSDVSSMPTLILSHEVPMSGALAKLTATTRLNEEYVSFEAGISKSIGRVTMRMSTERLLQRQATVYKKEDLGWHHTVGLSTALTANACVEADVCRKTTDSKDKDITDLRLRGALDTAFGSFHPEYVHIARGDGKTGKKVSLAFRTAPSLFGASGATVHAALFQVVGGGGQGPRILQQRAGRRLPRGRGQAGRQGPAPHLGFAGAPLARLHSGSQACFRLGSAVRCFICSTGSTEMSFVECCNNCHKPGPPFSPLELHWFDGHVDLSMSCLSDLLMRAGAAHLLHFHAGVVS
ncbi:hypothetical protein DIPPA_18613 [Diplonema papillatum]|nr:hypothetical protein DIPPA_18613 [Diplonema papillatum]